MRIERVDLKAFGRFTDITLDLSAGPSGFHMIYGPNESGKSTTLRAILAWLFGMPPRSTDNYLHSYPNMRVGGRLSSDHYGVLECIRRKGKAKTLLTPDEAEAVDPARLGAMLGGIDEETFIRGFGLDRDRLVEGGRGIVEGQGDMGEILFAAGVGIGRLRDVQIGLERELRELFLPSGSKPALNQSLAELGSLRTRMRAATLPTNDYKRRCAELDSARGDSEKVAERLAAIRARLAAAERLREAIPLVHTRTSLCDMLQPLGDAPLLDEDFIARRREAEANLQIAVVQRGQLEEQAEKLRRRIAALPDDDALTPYTPRIETLARRLGAREEAREHLRGLEKRREQAEADIGELLERIGRPATADLQSLRIPDVLRDRIWRLTEEGTRHSQQVESHTARLSASRAALAQAEKRWQELEPPGDPGPLDVVLRRLGNPQRMVDEIRKAEETLADKHARADSALRRLSGFRGSRADGLKLRPPLETAVRRLGDALLASEAEHERVTDQWQALQRQQKAVTAELEDLRNEYAIPSEAELSAARKARDERFEQLVRSPHDASENAPAVRTAIIDADRIVDRMRQEAERVAQRARAETQLANLAREIDECEQRTATAKNEREEALAQWQTLWRDATVEPRSPEEMRNWLDAHEAFVDAAHEAEAAERSVAGLRADRDAALHAVTEALRTAGGDGTAGGNGEIGEIGAAADDFVSTCIAAERSFERLAKRTEAYAATEKEVARLRAETQQTASELAAAKTRWTEWQAAWAGVTETIGAPGDATPEEVRHLVGQIDDILEKKRERDQHQQRIDGIRRDSEAFAEDVANLVADTSRIVADAELSEMSPHQAIERLNQRLLHFQTAARERKTLLEQHDENERQMRHAQDSILRFETILQELCREVGCEGPNQLPEIERRSAERRRTETELRQTESQLERLAAGRPLDELVAEASGCDLEQLSAEIEQLRLDSQSLDDQLGGLREQVGALRRDVESMDGSSDAAEISQQMQGVTARAAKQARTYAQLRVASLALARAIEHYRQQNQGPILSRAEAIFSRLTCGDYEALRPQFDEKGHPVLVGIRREGETPVPANCLSEGTADALFLALRLASLEAHLQRRGPIPLIIDDILTQFDDIRSAAALGVLADIGRSTQVIFFTHHQHLIELAQAHLRPSDYHVHRL